MAATGADIVEADVNTGVNGAAFYIRWGGSAGAVDANAEGFDHPVVSEEGIGASAFSKRACWSLATQFLRI